MRISNQQLFENSVNQMTQQHSKVADLQSRIAEGKQLLNPSDNAEKTALIQRLNSALGRQKVYESTLDSVSARLDLEESTIRSSTDMLQRLKELALLSNDGSISSSDRATRVFAEVTQLREGLLSQANQQDMNGNYVFSGSDVQSAAFTEISGITTYSGNQDNMAVDISETRYFTLNRPGDAIFSNIDRGGVDVGFFQVIDDFISALGTNTGTDIERALSEIDTLSNNMAEAIGDVGARQRTVDSQKNIIADTKLRYELMLNAETELDYTLAITQLTSEMLSLEAAQASFAKISQLSLFDYIR